MNFLRAPLGPTTKPPSRKARGRRAGAQWARGPPGGAVGARTALRAPGRGRAQPGRPGTFSSRSPCGPHAEPLAPLCTGQSVSRGHRQRVRCAAGPVPVPPRPRLGRERRTGARAARPGGERSRPPTAARAPARGGGARPPSFLPGGRRPTRTPWPPGPRGREAAAPGPGPPSERREVSTERGRRGRRGRPGRRGARRTAPALCGAGGAGRRWPRGSARWAPAPRRGLRECARRRVRSAVDAGSAGRVWQEARRAREPSGCGAWGGGAGRSVGRSGPLCARPVGGGRPAPPRGTRRAGAAAQEPGTRGAGGPAWATRLQGSAPAAPGQAPGLRRPPPAEAARGRAPRRGQARLAPFGGGVTSGLQTREPVSPDSGARPGPRPPRRGTGGRGDRRPRARGARAGRTRGDIWSLGRVGAARPEAAGPWSSFRPGRRSGPPPGKPGRGRRGRGSEWTAG